ncbi:MAG: DUF1801 domain-containing protein [Acidobacteriota bacterium]
MASSGNRRQSIYRWANLLRFCGLLQQGIEVAHTIFDCLVEWFKYCSELWGIMMKTNQTTPKNIDEYIAGFPDDIQRLLENIRQTIRKAAPKAQEAIKYRMPTFTLNGNLVHFAAFKNHIGFYPTPGAIEQFKAELSAYENSKGAVRFPLNKPIPFALISKMVKFRVKENLEKAAAKGKK